MKTQRAIDTNPDCKDRSHRNLEKDNLTMQYRIVYLEKQLLIKDRTAYKHILAIMEIEEKWKAATKRAHTLQLENNRIKKSRS